MLERLAKSVVRGGLCALLLCCNAVSPRRSASTPTPSPADLPPPPSPAAATISPPPSPSGTSAGADAFLDRLAQDTWAYLHSGWATAHHLPWSWRSSAIEGGDYANTTEIGLYALSWLAAYDLARPWSPSWAEAETEVTAILDQLRAWQTGSQSEQPHGPNAYQESVFYQWYWISWSPPVVGAGEVDQRVPSVDNAWLAASLITIREYAEANGHPTMAEKADAILDDLDFTLWYQDETHRFFWGATEDPRGGSQPGFYSDENRIINFVARALGHLDAEEFRASLEVLAQSPGSYAGITVEKVARDGSYFTYPTPALFIREMETPYGAGTIVPAAQAQIAYAGDRGYAAWGLSDCFDVGDGAYVQQGAPPTAIAGSPETRPGLVTPHASALALITPRAAKAITNLQSISDTFGCAYDLRYGFRDSVMTDPQAPDYGECSDRFASLAQEWIFLSLVNDAEGFVWDYFYRDPGVVRAHGEMFDGHQLYLPTVLLTFTPETYTRTWTLAAEIAPGDVISQRVDLLTSTYPKSLRHFPNGIPSIPY